MSTAQEAQERLFRVYQDCDPATPEDCRFLARVVGQTIGATILGPTKSDVEARAHAWLDEHQERRRRNLAQVNAHHEAT